MAKHERGYKKTLTGLVDFSQRSTTQKSAPVIPRGALFLLYRPRQCLESNVESGASSADRETESAAVGSMSTTVSTVAVSVMASAVPVSATSMATVATTIDRPENWLNVNWAGNNRPISNFLQVDGHMVNRFFDRIQQSLDVCRVSMHMSASISRVVLDSIKDSF